SRLGEASRGPRVSYARSGIPRPGRARRRPVDRFSRAARVAARVTIALTPDALAALCKASMPAERLTAVELEHLCFGERDEVLGDERAAAVLQTQRFGDYLAAWLILVAVQPGIQSRGRGKELVRAVAARARELGARELLLASAVPRYVWPGVDLHNTR